LVAYSPLTAVLTKRFLPAATLECKMKRYFNLYSSDGCHLCELALLVCQPLMSNNTLTIIDIVDDEKLVELYGVHIPVLERVTANDSSETVKLFWPFTTEQVSQLLV
jgi:hypothetical protein|tara:strand:- start:1022 stop:1342 length:321 start_codon:yes stop_codon:yes gene_type:complete